MRTHHVVLTTLAAALIAGSAALFAQRASLATPDAADATHDTPTTQVAQPSQLAPADDAPHLSPADDVRREFAAPIADAKARVTKKPFGLHITPETSPVEHDRFSGYHVGVDFETFAGEEHADVPVTAACDGPLVLKKQATGYGGVAVQACRLRGEDVTVIYGHLRLESVTAEVGHQLAQGERIGLLGQGNSPETDGVRKHLHLGIHRGTAISLFGYVKDEAEVSERLDAMAYLND